MTEHYVTQWRPDKGVWVLTAVSKLQEDEDKDHDGAEPPATLDLAEAIDLCVRR